MLNNLLIVSDMLEERGGLIAHQLRLFLDKSALDQDEVINCSLDGDGSGYGSGYSNGNGCGNDSSYSSGNGWGDGFTYGNGNGNGIGYGWGDGWGNGSNYAMTLSAMSGNISIFQNGD